MLGVKWYNERYNQVASLKKKISKLRKPTIIVKIYIHAHAGNWVCGRDRSSKALAAFFIDAYHICEPPFPSFNVHQWALVASINILIYLVCKELFRRNKMRHRS